MRAGGVAKPPTAPLLPQGACFEAATPGDLVAYGLLPEFVGRFPTLVSTSALSEPQLVRVLTAPRNAVVKQYALLFALHGAALHVTPEALAEVRAHELHGIYALWSCPTWFCSSTSY